MNGNGNQSAYQLTTDWFDTTCRRIWEQFMPQIKPQKVLEIGSFEGASAAYLVEMNTWTEELELFCIDSWSGGIEHHDLGIDMNQVEERFDRNLEIAEERSANRLMLTKIKGTSDIALARLLANGHASSFDFIYVDGSHQAPDVLLDAVLAFKLAKVGGVIAFDDYLWAEDLPQGRDVLRSPKFAIDSFTNTYFNKVRLFNNPSVQVYLTKTSE